MDVFSRPLVAVDDSIASALAVDLALHLARPQRGSAVRFLSVVELAAAQAEHRKALDEAVDRACVAQVEASCTMRHGQEVDAILDEALDSNASCIVVGTHRSAAGITADLLRRSDVPVLVVHDGDPVRTGPILVAVDASPAAAAALETSIRIAAARSMRLALVHVCDPVRSAVASSNDVLREAAERARAQGAETTLLLRTGSIAEELLDAADRTECCMIAMGTHGSPSATERTLGRVTAAVVGRSGIPVLTARCGGARGAVHEWRRSA